MNLIQSGQTANDGSFSLHKEFNLDWVVEGIWIL